MDKDLEDPFLDCLDEEDTAADDMWKCQVTFYKKNIVANVYIPMLGAVMMVLRRTSVKPPKYAIDFEDMESSNRVMRMPVGDGLSITYHEGTASLLITFITVLDGNEEIINGSSVLNGESREERSEKLRSFLEAYHEATYKAHMGEIEGDDFSADEDADPGTPLVDSTAVRVSESMERAMDNDDTLDIDVYSDDDDDDTSVSPGRVRGGKGTYVMFADNVVHNRLLVLRDEGAREETAIDVCAYNEDGLAPSQHTITNLNYAGKKLKPNELINMPTDDTKALLLDPSRGNGLYIADLNQEKVVSEYQAVEDSELAMVHMLPTDSSSSLVTCLTHNNVFAMDLRGDPRKCGLGKADGLTKTVHELGSASRGASKRLVCHATSKDGKLAVGDYGGDIRLFSGTPGVAKQGSRGVHPKTAKTLLKGDGHPVRFLDISSKGDWLLATYDKYLLLMNIEFNGGKNGFETRMGQHKPLPVKLTLDLEQKKSVGLAESFGKARFESLEDRDEVRIVASIGNALVSWNFEKIKEDPDVGRLALGLKRERGHLVDVAAHSNAVKYITEDSISMTTPHRQKSPFPKGKFTVKYRVRHRLRGHGGKRRGVWVLCSSHFAVQQPCDADA
eukprot:Sspe_Gene.6848::Locus_2302_Transcript_1_1_Confidence_1.000_Length_1982::g.6848::m.6848